MSESTQVPAWDSFYNCKPLVQNPVCTPTHLCNCLFLCRPGLVSIYSSGGVPYLVQLLASSVDAVLFYTIATLHNLLMHYIPSKMSICFAGTIGMTIQLSICYLNLLIGGLEKMVELLSKDNVKFLTITVDCLYMLAYRHQDRKVWMFSLASL